MSRSAFAKAFEEVMGTTPIEFVGRARLARAHELILATGDPIASIAESVGFASRSHFSSRFRERYGEDPTAYRKRMTSGPTAEQFASVSSEENTSELQSHMRISYTDSCIKREEITEEHKSEHNTQTRISYDVLYSQK